MDFIHIYIYTTELDGVPSFILRDCAPVFLSVLFRIFSLIFKCSIFSSVWKRTYICPIFKKCSTRDTEDYRSIFILFIYSYSILKYNVTLILFMIVIFYRKMWLEFEKWYTILPVYQHIEMCCSFISKSL